MRYIGITGSSGVLGEVLKKKFREFKIVTFDGDLTNKKVVSDWIFKNNFDAIFHFAAIVPVNTVEKKKKYTVKVNHHGTRNLVKYIKKKYKNINTPWFFYSSSSHVYALNKKKIKEHFAIKPISFYGKTKYLGELEIKKNILNYCIGRIFSFTDKKQNELFIIPGIINKIRKFKKSKNKFLVLENLNHTRDFLSAEQVVEIIIKLYLKKATGIYNICSGKGVKISDIAERIAKKLNKKIIINKTKKITSVVGDNKKLKKIIKLKKTDIFYTIDSLLKLR